MPSIRRSTNSVQNACTIPAPDPVYVQAIYEPSGHDLETRIGPEECRKQNAQLRCRDAKLILQHRSCDGEIATIYIVDEDGDSQQQENNRQSGCESFTLQ